MPDFYCVPERRYDTRLHSKTRVGSWLSLPEEVRLLILERLARDKDPGWSSAGSVCKEWQLVVAKGNLRKLKLDSSCLDEFGRIIVLQRDLVRHIWLNVKLQEYGCSYCGLNESSDLTESNGALVASAIRKLFSILSEWKPGRGLILELNAYSPSDSAHFFKGFHLASDDEGSEGTAVCAKWHDPYHGWVHGNRLLDPPDRDILRLFGKINPQIKRKFPQVDAVTCLIIRRQMRRSLACCLLRPMLNRLCRLEHIIHEPWRTWADFEVRRVDSNYLMMVKKALPAALKRLCVFEDFDENIAAALAKTPMHQHTDHWRIVDPRMGAAFAVRSLSLEHLSVSYMVNAEDFFSACEQSWTWHHLETLALTSQLLQHAKDNQDVNPLLYNASAAALQMPKLRTMVFWHGTRGRACAFIYQLDVLSASITWRGTWDLELSSRVVEGWQLVASNLHSLPLQTKKQGIQDEIKSHGDAIHYLNLPCRVVEPASLWQIRREGTQRTV